MKGIHPHETPMPVGAPQVEDWALACQTQGHDFREIAPGWGEGVPLTEPRQTKVFCRRCATVRWV